MNMAPIPDEIRSTGPPPFTAPWATSRVPCRSTGTKGNSETMRRGVSAMPFSARIVTLTLDGMETVMSPLPVAKYESDAIAPTG